MQRQEPSGTQRRAAVVTAIVLAAVAIGIYLTVIAKFMVYG